MKCYYEVLGVERDAEEKEIKTSYRKLALRWHPDKNMDRLDEAKEQFQLLQQAYEVLSDPQERAWYDKHREEILRGKDSNYEDSCLDVFAYFTSSCFKGYGDDAKGFFAVYRDVFEQIATEDIEFYEDPDEVEAIPKFGDSKSSYDEVVGPFYAHWQAYCTKKSYAWLCPFNVKEYRDRRILREIEKETKKIVQKAKRERNEEVRNLVSFIRKRDPRVKAYKQQLEERAAENRKKQEQNRLEQYKRRQQEVEEMKKTQQNNVPEGYEEQLRKLAQDYGGSEEDEFTDDEEGDGEGESDDEAAEGELEADDLEYVDDLYCVACNKSFKNQNAFANHESSKKHKENVERMRSEMEEEEEMYLNSNGKADSDLEEVIEDDDEADLDDLANRIGEELVLEEDDIQDLSEVSDGGVPLPMQQSKSSKKSKKKKRKQAVEVIPDDDDEEVEAEPVEEVVPEPDDSAVEARKGSKKSKKAKRKQAAKAASDEELPQEPPTEPSGSFEEEPAKAKKKGGKQKSKAKSHQQAGDSSGSAGESDEDDEEGAAKKPSANPSLITTNTSLGCAKCGATFPSKNKLFAHLKLTQHSIYLPKPPAADEPKGKKAKDKKKKK